MDITTDLKVLLNEQIGWIVLNRPDVKNAISREMWESIPRALDFLRDGGARVVVFSGEGDTFSAGADLAELSKLKTMDEAVQHWLAIRDALNTVASFELPTIAKITGACMGGGCLLALACDLRYCRVDARFSIPVAQHGISLDQDNIARLITTVGKAAAAEMLYTAAIINGRQAAEIGLVNSAISHHLDGFVDGIAKDIKQNSSASITQIKSAITQICQRGRVEDDQAAVIASYLSDEFQQRVAKALSRKS
jgi:enoyl-CoA hydratase/carnithine racemase